MDARNMTYMFYGFLAAWLIVIGYVISIAMREGRLRQELDLVKRLVEGRESEQRRESSRAV